MDSKNTTVVAETRFLKLVTRNNWDFVVRNGSTGIVCVAALTDENEVIIVEQFREPLGANVLELPAGLAGDIPGHSDEPIENAARRELVEETGYQAVELEFVLDAASSAGLTDESVSFYVAKGVTKVGEGGGDESESIRVHLVKIDEIDQWVTKQLNAGKMVDAKLFTGLYFLRSKSC